MKTRIREGVDLQSALQTVKEIDQQSEQAGFNQETLDQMVRQRFANARFEINFEEGMDIIEEFYSDKKGDELNQKISDETPIQGFQKKLRGPVQSFN
ncbi:hydrolase or metal-binding protein [Acinetobacter calcoaceticus]